MKQAKASMQKQLMRKYLSVMKNYLLTFRLIRANINNKLLLSEQGKTIILIAIKSWNARISICWRPLCG